MLYDEILSSKTIYELDKIKTSLCIRRQYLENMLDDVFNDEREMIELELNEISKSLETLKKRRNIINDEI